MPTIDPIVLVCSVGGSPAPVIHSLSEHKPSFVLFVCSVSSVPAVEEQILASVDFQPRKRILVLSNEQDLLACVMDIRTGVTEALEDWGLAPDSALLGDFTGGTKVMSAALVMALMERNVQFTYIGGGLRTKDGLGIVQDGEERLMRLANPWQVLAFAHIQQLADAFSSCQFQEAEKLARLIAEHGVRPRFFEALADLCHAYALWDGFQYAEAAEVFEPALLNLEAEAGASLENFCTKARQNGLALKTAAAELADFMEHHAPCPGYLRDLAANALRREQQGHYDDAVARLYSLLEKAAKIALLCDYGLDTSCIAPEELPQSFLDSSSPIIGHGGCLQLPLFRAYLLLASLKHPLGLRFMEYQETLKALLQARNSSLLAHGFEPVSGETCAELRKLVLDFLDMDKRELICFPILKAEALK
ncbi:TIGR02710 family CRISPR-associated CARF protein [Mailhella sp.]